MTDPLHELSESQIARLKFIEEQLLWVRRYTSNAMVDRFGISKALAHKDVAKYKQLFPSNIAPFDARDGFLKPATTFSSQIVDPCCPPKELITQVPKIKRSVNGRILELILKAIDQMQSLEVIYASSTAPLGNKRLITPSQVINASNRLHFRGYCHVKKSHRDFVISRCMTLPKIKKTPKKIPEDKDLKSMLNVTLKVNESLCEDGRRLIEKEYRLELEMCHKIPKALFHYFLIDNNLPVTQEQLSLSNRQPWVYPLLVEISEEQKEALFAS